MCPILEFAAVPWNSCYNKSFSNYVSIAGAEIHKYIAGVLDTRDMYKTFENYRMGYGFISNWVC